LVLIVHFHINISNTAVINK